MGFNNIDSPGNRHDRRMVAAIQRRHGAEARIEAAKQKRMRKAARQFERDIDRTIAFFAMPKDGINLFDPEGAYVKQGTAQNGTAGQYQVIVVGKMKARADHYVKAVGAFIKQKVKLISNELMEIAVPSNQKWDGSKEFRSIIVEVV